MNHISHICLTCGQSLPELPLGVDLTNNVFTVGTGSVKLQPKVAELAYALIEAYPNGVHKERIMFRLYGNGERAQEKVLDVYAWKLRSAIKPLGYDVRGEWTDKLKLVRAEENQ